MAESPPATHHYPKVTPMYRVTSQMPPLRHFLPDQPFDISKSEVVRWLCQQPEVQQTIFNTAKRHNMMIRIIDRLERVPLVWLRRLAILR
jgi:hypothetical protein